LREKDMGGSTSFNINLQDSYGFTYLMRCTLAGHDINSLLLEGADMDIQTNKGETALMIAISSINIQAAKTLILIGADLHLRESHTLSALALSIIYRYDVSFIKQLIYHGVDPNEKYRSNLTPLRFAIINFNPDIINFLIDSRADINARTIDKDTHLIAAIRIRNFEAISLLIERGADLEAIGKMNTTVLHYGVYTRCPKIMKLLIKACISTNVEYLLDYQDNFGDTPLIIASRARHSSDIVKLLLDNGSDMDLRDNYGKTAMMYAYRYHNYSSFHYLTDSKYDLNIFQNYKITWYPYKISKNIVLTINDHIPEMKLMMVVYGRDIIKGSIKTVKVFGKWNKSKAISLAFWLYNISQNSISNIRFRIYQS
jgi:ankyrin repeat protein